MVNCMLDSTTVKMHARFRCHCEDWVISSIAKVNILQICQIAKNIQHGKDDLPQEPTNGATLV